MNKEIQDLNKYAMKVTKAINVIEKLYLFGKNDTIKPHQATYLLLGSPGIGKTETIKQLAQRLAEKLGCKLVTENDLSDPKKGDEILEAKPGEYFVFISLNLSEKEPTDFSIPSIVHANEKGGVFYNFHPAWVKAMTIHPGIFFVDDVTNATREDLISILYQLFGSKNKKIAEKHLNKNLLVIAAGNTELDTQMVRKLPVPILNRLIKIHVMPPSGNEWYEYMVKEHKDSIPKDVIAFCAGILDNAYSRSEILIDKEYNETMLDLSITTPRSLEEVLYTARGLGVFNKDVSEEVIKEELIPTVVRCLDMRDSLELLHYLEKRRDLNNLLNQDRITTSTAIAGLTYIGDLIDSAYNGVYESLESSLIPPKSIPNIIENITNKNSKELLTYFYFGANIGTKDMKINETLVKTNFALKFIDKLSTCDNINKIIEHGKKCKEDAEKVRMETLELLKEKNWVNITKEIENSLKNNASKLLFNCFNNFYTAKIEKIGNIVNQVIERSNTTFGIDTKKIKDELTTNLGKVLSEKEIDVLVNDIWESYKNNVVKVANEKYAAINQRRPLSPST